MALYRTFEDHLDTIAVHAWEQWTNNGLNLDDDDREQTMKSVKDAASNTWVEGISDLDWLEATVARLRGEA